MHINVRSINKKIEAINQMLSMLKIDLDITDISETWNLQPTDLIKLICNQRKSKKASEMVPQL